jgi:hypothetical protein
MIAAARLPLRSEPENSQVERPGAHGRRRGLQISRGEIFVLAYTKKLNSAGELDWQSIDKYGNLKVWTALEVAG